MRDMDIIPPHIRDRRDAGMDTSQPPKARLWRCLCGEITAGEHCPRCGAHLVSSKPRYTCDTCGLLFYTEDLPQFCPECGKIF